jgi:hypothetical protein
MTKKEIVFTNGYCDWCDNQCGATPYIRWFENEYYQGWYSPQCILLAKYATDAIDNDDS